MSMILEPMGKLQETSCMLRGPLGTLLGPEGTGWSLRPCFRDLITITNTQIKQTRKNLMSRYLSSDASDILSRLKMGKTLFNNQLHHIGREDSPHCKNCLRETNTETHEDMKHALHSCPTIQHLMSHIIQMFFPNNNHTFSSKNTILSIMEDFHPLYEGKAGHTLASLV